MTKNITTRKPGLQRALVSALVIASVMGFALALLGSAAAPRAERRNISIRRMTAHASAVSI